MTVNLLEEDRLVYHDEDGDTLEVDALPGSLNFNTELDSGGVEVDRDAAETLRDAITTWLETGKLR